MSPSSRTAPGQCHERRQCNDKAQRVTGVVLSIGSNVGEQLFGGLFLFRLNKIVRVNKIIRVV